MIISHRYRFIFVRTRKVASSSLEVCLSGLLTPDDFATPQTEPTTDPLSVLTAQLPAGERPIQRDSRVGREIERRAYPPDLGASDGVRRVSGVDHPDRDIGAVGDSGVRE